MRTLTAALLAGLLLIPTLGQTQTSKADQADSLDFEAFHQEKQGAITIWDSDKSEFGGLKEKKTTAVYEEMPGRVPAPKQTPATEALSPNEARASALQERQQQEKLARGQGYNGERFMIRSRYNPAVHNSTATAIDDLHRQMATLCPQGWIMVREWSLPVAQDFYLHYLFQCSSD